LVKYAELLEGVEPSACWVQISCSDHLS